MVNKKQRVFVFFLLMLLSAGAYSEVVPIFSTVIRLK